MGLQEKMLANKAAITGLFNKASNILKGKRPTAKLSDVTLKVGGYTLSALTTFIRTSVVDHLTKTGTAGHGETASQLGLLTNPQLTVGMSQVMPQDIVPIARYGSLNYLPPGLTGAYDSGTTPTTYRVMAGLIEDDGTFVYLRNGTNGSSRGVYYAYCRAVLSNPSAQPTRTSRRYAPSYFPVGASAQHILIASDSCILGRLQDASGTAGDYFLSITNGTMDDKKHVGAVISQADFATYGGNYGEVALHGNTIYLFTMAYSNALPIQFNVFTVPEATVRNANGAGVTFTKQTGWTTTGFDGTVFNKDTLYFADKVASAAPGDNAMIHLNGTYTSSLGFYFDAPSISSVLSADGSTIRMKLWGHSRFTWVGGDYFAVLTFSWTLNPVTKVCKLDSEYEESNTINQGTNIATTYSGPIYQAVTNDLTLTAGQWRAWSHYDNAGNVVKFGIASVTDNIAITVGKIANFTDKYSAYSGFTKVSRVANQLTITPQFGSAVGSNIMGPILLDATTLFVYTDGARANGAYFRAGAYTKLEGDPTHDYASVTQTPFKGWAPSKTRKALSDIGFDDNTLRGTVNEINGTKVSLSGKRFVRGLKAAGVVKINPDFTVGAIVSVSESAFTSIDTALRAYVEAQMTVVTQTTVVDLVVPDNGCPPFCLFSMLTVGGAIYFTVAKIRVTTDASGNITAASLNGTPPLIARSVADNATAIPVSLASLRQGGNVAIYESDGSYLVGMTGTYNNVNLGANWLISIMFRINKTTGEVVTSSMYKGFNFNYYGTTRGFMAMPGRGLGAVAQSAATTDDTTKLVWHPIAATDAAFDLIGTNYQAPIADRIVLASQDVPEGFVVYFSEETPLVLGGRYYVLPVSNIDLTTIKENPANSTFYVYARIVDGEAVYEVSTALLAESSSIMLLGRVLTTATQIGTIAVDKVTRIGLHRLSPTAKGLAIPVAEGFPSQPSHLEWR